MSSFIFGTTWTWVLHCDESCEQRLYFLEQNHVPFWQQQQQDITRRRIKRNSLYLPRQSKTTSMLKTFAQETNQMTVIRLYHDLTQLMAHRGFQLWASNSEYPTERGPGQWYSLEVHLPLSTEKMWTTLRVAEEQINSCPLTYCSNDTTDPLPLTPAEIIIGRPFQWVKLKSKDMEGSSLQKNLLHAWRNHQTLADSF